MSIWEIIFWGFVAFVALIFLFVMIYQQGRQIGCHKHEFRIRNVVCIHCGREESRTAKHVVETRDNLSAPTSTQ